MTFQLDKLNPRHFKILDLCIRGLSAGEIAEELSMHKNQISAVINSPNFQHQLSIRRASYEEKADAQQIHAEDEATRVLKESAVEAAQKLKTHLTSEDDTVSLRSATAILDRTGHAKREPTGGVAVQINISSEDAKIIAETIDLEKSADDRTRPKDN